MAAWVKGDLGLFVADGGFPLETELDERPARPAERARQALELGCEPATTKGDAVLYLGHPSRAISDGPAEAGRRPAARGARACTWPHAGKM